MCSIRVTSPTQIQGPTISKLPPEVYQHVFMMNADLEVESITWGKYYRNARDSPLNTTRTTSQVCHVWREIILGSPMIWASIVELQNLRQNSEHWRKEVMRRTGSVNLCIRGDVKGDDESATSFFLSLLNDHWERIRYFNVTILDLPGIDPADWNALKQPARNLEVFRLIFPRMTSLPIEYLTTDEPDDFFSGQVPLIRDFHCPELNFSPLSRWIPQLHSITISNPLTFGDLFSLLAVTPLLESLRVEETVLNFSDTKKKSRIIHLPALKRIDLEHRFQQCLLILEKVVPSAQCVLYLSTRHTDFGDMTENEINRLKAVLVQYSEGHSNLRGMKKLRLSVAPKHLLVSAHASTPLTPNILRTEIFSSCEPLPLDFFPSVLGTFSSCNFSSVTALELLINHEGFSEIPPFILSLSSVEVIHADMGAIPLVFDVQQKHPQVFPLLHTLIWAGPALVKIGDHSVIKHYLLSILQYRKDNRVPIKILDLVQCDVENIDVLKFLDPMSGLKVRWWGRGVIEEYTCGERCRNTKPVLLF